MRGTLSGKPPTEALDLYLYVVDVLEEHAEAIRDQSLAVRCGLTDSILASVRAGRVSKRAHGSLVARQLSSPLG
jgi:hypothetical protein